jgi:hypothetical protein
MWLTRSITLADQRVDAVDQGDAVRRRPLVGMMQLASSIEAGSERALDLVAIAATEMVTEI